VKRWAKVLRLARRLVAVAAVVCALAFVGVQFEGIVAKNVAMQRDLVASRAEIAALQKREGDQERTLRRLASPEGAVPEIHAKLRLVGPHEEIIYVRGLAPADADADMGTGASAPDAAGDGGR
jgi:cell division protein FtsB